MTYCFTCEQDVTGEHKALCKDSEHDLDMEGLYEDRETDFLSLRE